MRFNPIATEYPYTEYTDGHYLKITKDNGQVFDTSYNYVDTSFSYRFKRFWVRFLLIVLVFPLMKIRLGLKIKGRENLKKNGEILKGGAITVSNHVHLWDYIAIMKALRPKWPMLLAWKKNLNGQDAALVRLVGGIPIPEGVAAFRKFNSEVENYISNSGYLHIYPEGSMWEYYEYVRPFKRGAFHYSVKLNKPVIPMAFSYRRPGGPLKKFRKACFTLEIGEPLLPDPQLKYAEAVEELAVRCHKAVTALAGLSPEENLYESLYDHSRKKPRPFEKEGNGEIED